MIITCKAVADWIVYLSVWRDGRLGLWHYHRGISDGVEAFLQKWWRSCHLGEVRRSITSEAHSVLQSRTPTLLLLQIITGRHDVRLLLKVFFFVRIFLFLINMPRCTFTPPAALRNNLFRKHNGWLTMHVFDITLSAFELLDFYLAAPVFRYRSWCRGFYFDQRLALSHRPQVAKTWYICDNSIVKPRNPPKKAVRKMLTTCQDVNTIAVKPRFTVPANWFEVSLLGFFVLIFFLLRTKWLEVFQCGCTNVQISFGKSDALRLHCRWWVIESSWVLTVETFHCSWTSYLAGCWTLVNPDSTPWSLIVPFRDRRQIWVIVFD